MGYGKINHRQDAGKTKRSGTLRLTGKEFKPAFDQHDLISLPKYSMYLKLMIDGATSQPFSALTVPITHAVQNNKVQIVTLSSQSYGTPKSKVEMDILNRHKRNQTSEGLTLF